MRVVARWALVESSTSSSDLTQTYYLEWGPGFGPGPTRMADDPVAQPPPPRRRRHRLLGRVMGPRARRRPFQGCSSGRSGSRAHVLSARPRPISCRPSQCRSRRYDGRQAGIADLTHPGSGQRGNAAGVSWWTTIPSPYAMETTNWPPGYLGGWQPRSGLIGAVRDRTGRGVVQSFKRVVHTLNESRAHRARLSPSAGA